MKFGQRKSNLGRQVNWSHPLARGLVNCWLMNEGSGNKIYDRSGNQNKGAFYGDTHFVPGKFGSCLNFDGNGDYVQFADILDIGTKNLSISIWIKVGALPDFACQIVNKRRNTAGGDGYGIGITSAGLLKGHFGGASASTYSATGTTNVDDDKWHHLTGIWDRTGNLSVYVDGRLEGTIDISAESGYDAQNSVPLRIGVGALNTSDNIDTASYFNGLIDNIQIYNRTLSAAEIQQLYREPFCMFDKPQIWPVTEVGGETHELVTSIEGAGEVSVELGRSFNLNTNIEGAGDVTAKFLPVHELNANIAGSGEVTAELILIHGLNTSIEGAGDVSAKLGGSFNLNCSVAETAHILALLEMAHWLGITSANIDSFCGEDVGATLANGLDGGPAPAKSMWTHLINATHWFILDLGATYTITKVRGRSQESNDPGNVNIYVSTDGVTWGDAVAANIATWQDTAEWQEVNCTSKDGQYIKVEITAIEGGRQFGMEFGFAENSGYPIFDVSGELVAAGETYELTANIAGSGDVTAELLLVHNLEASIEGIGSVSVEFWMFTLLATNIAAEAVIFARLMKTLVALHIFSTAQTAANPSFIADRADNLLVAKDLEIGENIFSSAIAAGLTGDKWKLEDYAESVVTATGYIRVNIGGVNYNLVCATT